MGSIVAILNQKGGVGKTTVTLGLAGAGQRAGLRILVVDLDPQASSTWVLGVDLTAEQPSVADLLSRSGATPRPITSGWADNVHVVASRRDLQDNEAGSPTRLRAALHKVAGDYDLVLIDCPPSLGNLTTSGLTAADHAVIVVEPSALGLRGIGAVADVIDEVWDHHNAELELTGVIVNKVPAVSGEADRRLDELVRIVGRKAIWQPMIPQRVVVNQAIGERRPVQSYGSRAHDVTQAFDALLAKLRRATKR